jgi:hypothetical protein
VRNWQTLEGGRERERERKKEQEEAWHGAGRGWDHRMRQEVEPVFLQLEFTVHVSPHGKTEDLKD